MSMKSRNTIHAVLLLASLTLVPASVTAKDEQLTETARKLQQKFANSEETLEYHFMLKVSAFTDGNRDQVVGALTEALKPIVQIGKLSGPKSAAYIDNRERVLDREHLILRLCPGQLTIKARTTLLNGLIDLEPCQSIKYEKDYFEEPGFSISSEYKFKKDEWLDDPTKATVGQTMEFMQAKCPALARQLEPYLKPIDTLKAPGAAQMYAAEIKLDHPLSASFKESGFSLWGFAGAQHALAEIAWTGLVKDKAALDQLYEETREKLSKAGCCHQTSRRKPSSISSLTTEKREDKPSNRQP